jgi:O-antigen ligase
MLNRFLLSASPSEKLTKSWLYAGFILLALYVLILPVNGTIALRNLFFFVLFGITVCLILGKKLKLNIPLVCPWIAYATVALISLTYAINVKYSLSEIKTEILFGFMAMILGAAWINNRNALMGLIATLIAGNILLILLGFYVAYDIRNVSPVIQAAPFKIGVGKFSTYILMIMPLIAAFILQDKKYRAWGAVLLIANIVALYFTANRLAFICLAGQISIALFMIGVIKKKIKLNAKLLILALTMLLIVVYMIVKRGPNDITLIEQLSTDARWGTGGLWSKAIADIIAHPFGGTGFGIQGFKMLHPEISQNNGLLWHAHNVFLNIGVQMGIPGIITLVILIGFVLYRLWAHVRSEDRFIHTYAVAGILMTIGLFLKVQTDDFFNRDIALLFWLLTGALIQTLKNAATSTPIRK